MTAKEYQTPPVQTTPKDEATVLKTPTNEPKSKKHQSVISDQFSIKLKPKVA